LRVAQRAVEYGLLRVTDKEPPRPSWRAILGIEEWLVGSEPASAPEPEPVAAAGTLRGAEPAPAVDARGQTLRKPRRQKKRRASSPQPAAREATPDILSVDWGALVPRIVGAEVGPLAGAVPATHVSGEITAASRAAHDRLDVQPTVVFDEAAEAQTAPDARPA